MWWFCKIYNPFRKFRSFTTVINYGLKAFLRETWRNLTYAVSRVFPLLFTRHRNKLKSRVDYQERCIFLTSEGRGSVFRLMLLPALPAAREPWLMIKCQSAPNRRALDMSLGPFQSPPAPPLHCATSTHDI